MTTVAMGQIRPIATVKWGWIATVPDRREGEKTYLINVGGKINEILV
jgi:hypothetical protein